MPACIYTQIGPVQGYLDHLLMEVNVALIDPNVKNVDHIYTGIYTYNGDSHYNVPPRQESTSLVLTRRLCL